MSTGALLRAQPDVRIFTQRRQFAGIPHWVPVLLLLGVVGVAVVVAVLLERSRTPETAVRPPAVLSSSVAARFAAVGPGSIPAYLAIARSGTVFVGSRVQSAVLRFDASGKQLTPWGPELGPDVVLHDVAGLASNGTDLFVVDAVDHRIVHLDADGRLVGAFSFEPYGTYGAGALAVNAEDKLYLADTGGNRVLVFGADGAFIGSIGATGSGAGQLKQPVGLAFAPDGALYVADLENHRIAWWHADATPGGAWPIAFSPWGVTVDPQGRVYVPEVDGQRMHVYSADGVQVGEIDEHLADGPGLNFLSQAAIAPGGATLWVGALDGLLKFDLQTAPPPSVPNSTPSIGVPLLAALAAAAVALAAFALQPWWRPRLPSGARGAASLRSLLPIPREVEGEFRDWPGGAAATAPTLETPVGAVGSGRRGHGGGAATAATLDTPGRAAGWEPAEGTSGLGGGRSAARTASLWLGSAAWVVALGVAFVGQFAVASARPIEQARPWHLGAAVLACVGVWLLERGRRPAAQLTLPPLPTGRPRRRSAAGMGLGAALMLTAVPLTIARLFTPAAAAWILGIGVLIVGAAIAHPIQPRLTRALLVEASAALGVILLAFVLRFVDLAHLPPQVHGDEGAVGIEARKVLSGQVQNLFGVGWYELPNLSYAISAAFMRVFGDDLFGLRMASVTFGTATVLLTFLLVRHLFNTRVAMIAAALLAGAEMHVHYSRSGIIYMQAGCATVLLLYLMLRALRSRRLTDHVLFGLVGGLCIEVYAAARLAPVLAVLYLAHAIVRDRGFARRHATGLVLAGATGVLFFAPMTVIYAGHPDAFNVRSGDFVLGPAGLAHEMSGYGVSSVNDVIRLQAQRTLEGFIYTGETSDQYGHRAPLVDFWTGALLVVGVAAFGLRLRDPRYFLLSTWLWLTLVLGSVLTVDAPFSPHLVGMLPLLAIFPALFLEAGWQAAEQLAGRAGQLLLGAAVAAVVGLAVVANVRDYTQVHVVQLQPAGFPTVLSAYINEVNARYHVYLISRPETALGYDTTHFLVPDLDGTDLRNGPLAPTPPPPGKGMAFIVEAAMPDFSAHLAEVEQRYPSGRTALHRTTRGDLLFASVLVDP